MLIHRVCSIARQGDAELRRCCFCTASNFEPHVRDLIPQLSDCYHIVAPGLPGFRAFRHSAGCHLRQDRRVIGRFTEVVGLERFAIYIFDYGAPTGLRMALKHPERITAIITQNGNAYEKASAAAGIRYAPTGTILRQPTATLCVAFSRLRAPIGSTRTG